MASTRIMGPVLPADAGGEPPPTTEVASVEPERPAVGEGQLLGALTIRRLTNATDDDRTVAHRLNSGAWVVTASEQHVNTDPFLDYGAVFDQTSDPPGTVGGTTLVAMHNVTRPPVELTSVTIDGVTHSQPRMLLSSFNEQEMAKPAGTRHYRNNLTSGDVFEVTLNNPDRTVTVLSYEVFEVRDVEPQGPGFVALKDPPTADTESRIVVYSCWEPGDARYRQASLAVLRSRVTRPGSVSDPGPQPPRATATR